MCGLAGFITTEGMSSDAMRNVAGLMAASIAHRGPDDEGLWIDPAGGAALAFRRLAVLDLTELGHQPMISQDGRLVIAFNGEIYNFMEMARELEAEGVAFRGRSDTEVILEAFSRWGIERSVRRMNGMFAIALWDRSEKVLHLMRDRAGEKPLYCGWSGPTFFFGSQPKAFLKHRQFDRTLDPEALALFAAFGCIPAPWSVYRDIRKVMPGTVTRIEIASRAVTSTTYWSAREAAAEARRNPFLGSYSEAVSELEVRLTESVRRRMISDVPLGALLSGGIDSSVIVALMQEASPIPARTFTIGFAEASHDEAASARAVAAALKSEHTELIVTPEDAAAVIPHLPEMYDEPFADSSAIPTWLVSKLARSKVTVALTGDGGDELFGGYNRHVWAAGKGRLQGPFLKRPAAAMARLMSDPGRESMVRALMAFAPRRLRVRNPSDKLAKLSRVLSARNDDEAYAALTTHHGLERDAMRPPAWALPRDGHAPLAERMMEADFTGYLPDDILVKLDRASMAVGLEGRVPMLDPSVAELAWSLPMEMKISAGEGKRILRSLLEKKLPRALFDRPKMGFALPLGSWLRGPLREWAGDTLLSCDDTLFDRGAVLKRWAAHQAGSASAESELWMVLMFEQWRRAQKGG